MKDLVPEGDQAEFQALVDELDAIEHATEDRPELANRRAYIDRRLIELVSTKVPADERRQHVRLPCDLWIKVHAAGEQKLGVVSDIGAGGAFVASTLTLAEGAPVAL